MAQNVSPGVYTKIIDLSQFVQAVPSTIGFLCALTEKGEDNTLKFIGGRADYIAEFGEPNITTYGKNYGQGPYSAYNYLGESGALYFMRCLPDDASYSNMRIDASFGAADTTSSITITFVDSLNTETEIKTNLSLAAVPPTYPVCFLYPIGRGQWYNSIGVRITEVANPTLWDQYIIDIYERQSDGEDEIIESFEISFDPTARDGAGDSLWIVDVLNTYSSVLRADMELVSGAYSSGYNAVVKVYDKNIGTVVTVTTGGAATITDSKQDFSDWDTLPEVGNANYSISAKDAKGVEIWGWMGASSGIDGETVNVFNERALGTASQTWNGNTTDFDPTSEVEYRIKANISIRY